MSQGTGVMRFVFQARNLPQKSVAEPQPRRHHVVFSDQQPPTAVLETMVTKGVMVLNGDVGRPLVVRSDAREE